MEVIAYNRANEVLIRDFERTKSIYNSYIEKNKSTSQLRIREIANNLKVSEGELISLNIDNNVSCLNISSLYDFFLKISSNEHVMFLSRNENVVHEITLCLNDLVVHNDEYLRLFLNNNPLIIFNSSAAICSFAEIKEYNNRILKSIQIFDLSGNSLLKIYFKDNNSSLFNDIIDCYKKEYNYEFQKHKLFSQSKIDSIDQMFFKDVMTTEYLKCINYKRKYINDTDLIESILFKSSKNKYELGIYAISPSSIQFYKGKINKVVDYKGWLNILDQSFNLHLIKENLREYACIYYSEFNCKIHIHFYSDNDYCQLGVFSTSETDNSFYDYIMDLIRT